MTPDQALSAAVTHAVEVRATALEFQAAMLLRLAALDVAIADAQSSPLHAAAISDIRNWLAESGYTLANYAARLEEQVRKVAPDALPPPPPPPEPPPPEEPAP